MTKIVTNYWENMLTVLYLSRVMVCVRRVAANHGHHHNRRMQTVVVEMQMKAATLPGVQAMVVDTLVHWYHLCMSILLNHLHTIENVPLRRPLMVLVVEVHT